MKQQLLTLTNQFKKLNISIDDKKNWINLFGANYDKFLLRNKGITINNKEQLLQILNHKPRTLLSSLRIFVKGLVNYNSRLQLNTTASTYGSVGLRLRDQNFSTKGVLPNFVEKAQLEQVNKDTNDLTPKHKLIRAKIKELTQSLTQNKLAMPLNLLTPLLSMTNNSNLGSNQAKTNLNSQEHHSFVLTQGSGAGGQVGGELVNDFNLSEILSELKNPRLKLLESNNYHTSNSSKVAELTKLVEKYDENLSSVNSISKTQYSKLINPFKTVNSFEQNVAYNFNSNNNRKFTPAQQQSMTTLLEYAFRGMSCLISKPVFMETPKNLIINLFYFFVPGQVDMQKQSLRNKPFSTQTNVREKRVSAPIATSLDGIAIPNNPNKNINKLAGINKKANSSLLNLNQIDNFKLTNLTNMDKLNKLCTILSNIYNKPVELDLTRLNAPFFDDNILVKLIGLVSTELKPIRIFDSIYKNANIFNKRTADYNYSYSITRSFLAGIKIKIGGRLMTQRIVPKITTRHSQRGATATGKVTYLDWSRVTLKNKRGSHSITVTISHVI